MIDIKILLTLNSMVYKRLIQVNITKKEGRKDQLLKKSVSLLIAECNYKYKTTNNNHRLIKTISKNIDKTDSAWRIICTLLIALPESAFLLLERRRLGYTPYLKLHYFRLPSSRHDSTQRIKSTKINKIQNLTFQR